MERKNAWKGYDEAKSAKVDALAKDYMDFLDNGKTERECVDTIVNQIEAAGYRELPELMKEGKKLSAGDKVYAVWMNKTVVMFQIGTKPMTEGWVHISIPPDWTSSRTLCMRIPILPSWILIITAVSRNING